MAEATRAYITAIQLTTDGGAIVTFSSNTSERVSYVNVHPATEPQPTVGERLYAWATANPLKTQALFALIAGSLPEGLRQAGLILLA